MVTIKIESYDVFSDNLDTIFYKGDKKVVNTINAHSYTVAKKDPQFKQALLNSDILLPDGEGIVLMARILNNKKIKKIAGADIHFKLLEEAEKNGLRCFYLGANQTTLDIIRSKQEKAYPNIQFGFFSPPFKNEFSDKDTKIMLQQVNNFKPDILFVGMTAPKQEKWVEQNKAFLNAKIICSVGAVFDFVAETKKRAPNWVIQLKMEWLYRSFTAWRLTKRYMYSTPLFLVEILKLKFKKC